MDPRPIRLHQVAISGLASKELNSAISFVIVPGDTNLPSNDLQFQEFATYVERALTWRGFAQAVSIESADMAVLLVYGVGEPRQQVYSYALPVFGQTGIGSATTFGQPSGYSLHATTYFNPTYGITGFSSHTKTAVTYDRYIFVKAIDLGVYSKENKVVPIWQLSIASGGATGDLRDVFPAMIGAASDYFGTDTGRSRMVSIYEDNPRVRFVKGDLSTKRK
jgi:hypothetical protein